VLTINTQTARYQKKREGCWKADLACLPVLGAVRRRASALGRVSDFTVFLRKCCWAEGVLCSCACRITERESEKQKFLAKGSPSLSQ